MQFELEFCDREPAKVTVIQDGPIANIWLRKDITEDTVDNGPDGTPYKIWRCNTLFSSASVRLRLRKSRPTSMPLPSSRSPAIARSMSASVRLSRLSPTTESSLRRRFRRSPNSAT